MIGKEKKTETKPETNPSGDHPLCDSTQPSRCRQGLEGGHVGGGGGGGGGGGDGEDCVLDNSSFIDRMMRIMNGEGRGIGDERLRIS